MGINTLHREAGVTLQRLLKAKSRNMYLYAMGATENSEQGSNRLRLHLTGKACKWHKLGIYRNHSG